MSALALMVALAAAPSPVVTAHRKVVAPDGAALALYRYSLGEPAAGTPVLVVLDAGFGRALADPLARYLVEHGRTVFVAELRGQGASSPGHSLRALVHLDLPAIAVAIGAPVDLIAHGYVGSLALAAVGRELAARRVIALSTPMFTEPPTELQAWFLSDGGRFSSLGASPEGFAAFEQLFAMGSRFAPGDEHELLRAGTRDLSRGVSAELLAWLQSGDLPLDDGTSVVGRLRAFDRPTLMFNGLANAWAPSESCVLLRERSKAPVQLRTFNRFAEGDDFAHVSLLIGARARTFVWPAVEEFLR